MSGAKQREVAINELRRLFTHKESAEPEYSEELKVRLNTTIYLFVSLELISKHEAETYRALI